MSDSIIAIQYVLENEGGFVDNPEDKGGPTNFGLSQRFLNSLGGIMHWEEPIIKSMSISQAIRIYERCIWKPIYSEIYSQTICNYYFDMIVNHGENEATKMLQRSIWSLCIDNINLEIKDDGIFGEKTLHVVNNIVFLPEVLKATRAQYYRCLAKEPGQHQFLEGWLKRAYR